MNKQTKIFAESYYGLFFDSKSELYQQMSKIMIRKIFTSVVNFILNKNVKFAQEFKEKYASVAEELQKEMDIKSVRGKKTTQKLYNFQEAFKKHKTMISECIDVCCKSYSGYFKVDGFISITKIAYPDGDLYICGMKIGTKLLASDITYVDSYLSPDSNESACEHRTISGSY